MKHVRMTGPIAAFAVYFIQAALLLLLYNPDSYLRGPDAFPSGQAYMFWGYLVSVILGFTVVPWLVARYILKGLPILSLKIIALVTLAVSGGGFAFALLTSLLGNIPGSVCYTVQKVHIRISLLSYIAFWRTSRGGKNGVILLFLAGVLYFISGWFMPQNEPRASVRAKLHRHRMEASRFESF